MARTNVYADEDYVEDGLTFRKIGKFIKTGWLRMLIYAVIAVALVSVVVLPIKFFYKTEPVAQTTIEFIYDGIENGETPNGGTLDTDNIISTVVLANAVESAGLGGKIKDISSLRAQMRVSAVETEEYIRLVNAAANGDNSAKEQLRTYVMHPTRFDIIIPNPDSLGLSDAQAQNLLNKIVKSYQDDFKSRYSITEMFPADTYVLSQSETYEFTSVYDLYTASLNSIEQIIEKYTESAPDFISTLENGSFGTLASALEELRMQYNLFNNYIMINNVWRQPEVAEDSLKAEQSLIEVKRTNLETYIASLKTLIADIKPNTITSTDSSGKTVTTETFPAKYYEYIDRLDTSNRELLTYADQLSNIQLRLQKLGDTGLAATPDQQREAVAMLVKLEEETTAFVKKVNNLISDYYDTTFVSSSVRQIRQPVVSRKSSSMNLLVVYACAVIAGLLVGGIVTGVKIGKANAKRAKSAVRADIAEAPADANAETVVDTDDKEESKK